MNISVFSDQGNDLSGHSIPLSCALVPCLDSISWDGRKTEDHDRTTKPFGVSEALGSCDNLEPEINDANSENSGEQHVVHIHADSADTDDDEVGGSSETCSKSGSTVQILKTKGKNLRKTILKSWYDNLGLVLTPPTPRRKFDGHSADNCHQHDNIMISSWSGGPVSTVTTACRHGVGGGQHATLSRPSDGGRGQAAASLPGWSTLPRNWTPHAEDNDLVWLWFIWLIVFLLTYTCSMTESVFWIQSFLRENV